VVVRDPQGTAVQSTWKFMENVGSAKEAEDLACLEGGIRLATAWVNQPVHIESDCLSLVKALRSSCPDRVSWQGTVMENQGAKSSASRLQV
jgi:hypothetical protein